MIRNIGVVMDPIAAITPYKDTSLAILLEAQRRGWQLHYFELADLSVRDGVALGNSRTLQVRDDNADWFTLEHTATRIELGDLDVIFMRKDPPFDMEFVFSTYILGLAQQAGALVCNAPSALRDVNEKMATTLFPQLCPATLVSRDAAVFKDFLAEHQDIILKPLDGMGGARVFRVRAGDQNLSVIMEVLTGYGETYAMAQQFLPAIAQGDKRILLIDGEPVPYALARIPAQGELRGNLAAGGRGEGVALTANDEQICRTVGPWLRELGIVFAGLDVIGDKLTEINVTSPTCIRELDALYDLNIGAQLLDAVEARLQ